MFKSITDKTEREEGFTLIELMVVVLIIGILMAIAIPTFLGAKNSANARAAQSNLRNSVTAEQSYFTDNQTYGTGPQIATYEPAITYDTSTSPSFTVPAGSGNAVTVESASASTVELGAKGADKNCYYVYDNSGQVAYKTDAGCQTSTSAELGTPTFPVSGNSKQGTTVWGSAW